MESALRSVLIVEDDEAIRHLYTTTLEAAGFRVIATDNGEQAVQLALTAHPDVILMDIEMPKLDGHEAVRRIRADTWGKTASVIYLTNFSEPTDVYQAVANKSEAFIIKAHTPLPEIINLVRLASYQQDRH